MKLQRLLSLVRKACDDYLLIEENDKIAVGISGGKDSLTLLYALHELQRFYPKKFKLHAFTVDLGFGIQDYVSFAVASRFLILLFLLIFQKSFLRPAENQTRAHSVLK